MTSNLTTKNNPSKPGMKILIESEALHKLRGFIDGCPQEISGLGIVSREGNNPIIKDIFIGPQENTGSSTDMSDIDGLLAYALEAGYEPQDIRLWWHSHAKMGTFMSSTDVDTINQLVKYVGGWLLSVCGNHAGNWCTRLDVDEPFRMLIDNLEMVEINGRKCTCAPCQCFERPEIDEYVDAEIEAKVKIWTPPVKYFGGGKGKSTFPLHDEKKALITGGTDPLGDPLPRGGPLGGLVPITDHIRNVTLERAGNGDGGSIIIPDANWEKKVTEISGSVETTKANKGGLAKMVMRKLTGKERSA